MFLLRFIANLIYVVSALFSKQIAELISGISIFIARSASAIGLPAESDEAETRRGR
jgi:hypothetical protein